MRGFLLFTGIVLVAAGILWPWLARIPIGRLPGDIVIRRPGFVFYFPVTTMVIASIVASLVMWIWRR